MKADLNFNGVEYSLLAGPVFVAVYSVTGIFTGCVCDKRVWWRVCVCLSATCASVCQRLCRCL